MSLDQAVETGVVQPYRVLDPDGTLTGSPDLCPSDAEVAAALELMLLSRSVDEKAFRLQRQGRFGTFSQVWGQEASVVGTAMAIDPGRDWIVPQYRELPAMLRQGYPLENFLLYFSGNPRGGMVPEGVNCLPMNVALAAQLPHAVGLAWGLRHQGTDSVVLTYFGDGASSEGDAHEAMNLAGVTRAPVIFVLSDNGWAISTPRAHQSAAGRLAARGAGYGMPGVVVDGNDLLAVHEVTATAVARARAGEGPTLIEAITYRMGPHNTADDPTRYVDQEERDRWAERDPIDRVRAYLTGRGAWDDAAEQAAVERNQHTLDAALAAAAELSEVSAAQIFDHLYATPPPRLLAQRLALGVEGKA